MLSGRPPRAPHGGANLSTRRSRAPQRARWPRIWVLGIGWRPGPRSCGRERPRRRREDHQAMRANPQILLLLLLAASLSALPACSPGQGTKPAPWRRTALRARARRRPMRRNRPAIPRPARPRRTRVRRSAYRRRRPRTGTQPGPMRGPTRGPSAPMASSGSGAFRWHTRLADAQAQARREDKLILVGSTQAGCSLCVKFKNQIVPQAGTRLSSVAVGYMLD